ncbi:MAG: SoxR reducing system RseC family protein [Ignavibacteriales bacterium]|nr:SoxR reducing system RseC family protein [Ignavibacteriales bacterium]MCF8435803.1 SoxR reducing system RseC family protein [Ignavibacteriales bacterium]
MNENIIERGVVIKSSGGKAEIALLSKGNCEECTAKIFCRGVEDNQNIVQVIDSFGVKAGDNVKIEVDGTKILSATSILYGVPLLILIVSVLLGQIVFSDSGFQELYSFGSGIFLIALYFLLFKLIPSFQSFISFMPKIVSVSED